VATKYRQAATRGGVPYACGIVKGGGDDAGAVGTECRRSHIVSVTNQVFLLPIFQEGPVQCSFTFDHIRPV